MRPFELCDIVALPVSSTVASTLYTFYLVHFLHFVAGASGTTDLTLEAEDYDTSPDALVGAWCLLEAD